MQATNLTELIQLRWQELKEKGVTTYQLAKEYGKLKNSDPNDKRYNRYVSTVEKAIENPLTVSVETLERIKTVLGIETHYAIVERREVSFGSQD
jgi:hypothetical protein